MISRSQPKVLRKIQKNLRRYISAISRFLHVCPIIIIIIQKTGLLLVGITIIRKTLTLSSFSTSLSQSTNQHCEDNLCVKYPLFLITPLRSWWHPGRLSSPWLFSTTSGFAYFQWRWHLWTPQSSSFPQFIDAVKVFKMTAIDFQRSSKVILNPWYILLRWSSIELRSTK